MFKRNEMSERLGEEIERYDLDEQEIIARANYYLGQINQMSHDEQTDWKPIHSEWIEWRTILDAAIIHQNGFNKRLKKHNGEYESETNGTIKMPNKALGAIWLDMILPRIKQESWPNTSWKSYAEMRVVVNEQMTDVETNKSVFPPDFLGNLMENEASQAKIVFYVRSTGIEEDYDEIKLTTDLQVLSSWKRRVNYDND